MRNSCQGKCFHTSPFYQKNNAPQILLPNKRASRASTVKTLFSHRPNFIWLTCRPVLSGSAVSQTYLPDVPPLFRRRSEVHLSGRGRSCAQISFTSRVRELCARKPVQSRSVQMYRQTWTRWKLHSHGKNRRRGKTTVHLRSHVHDVDCVCQRLTDTTASPLEQMQCSKVFFFVCVGEVSRPAGGEMKSLKFPSRLQ